MSADPTPVEPELTTEQRLARLEQRQLELTWYVEQTRFACDCLFQYLTQGAAPGIPWENMGVYPEDTQQRPQRPPNRSARRQAAKDLAKRATTEGTQ